MYTQNDFILESIKKHGNKYDYSKVDYVNAHTKVCIICPEHGEFWQNPTTHKNGFNGCKKCLKGNKINTQRLTTTEFIERARSVHGNKYDYSKVKYVNNKISVCIICTEHGEFWQSPSVHLSGNGCKTCSGMYKKTTKEFIQKAKNIHGNKYDYSKVDYVNAHTKVCIICPEHGEFWQVPYSHITKKHECIKCGYKKLSKTNTLTKDQFIKKARSVHGNKYDYSGLIYMDNHTDVCIVCPEHGEFWQKPHNHTQGMGCSNCVSKTSTGEIELYEYISSLVECEQSNRTVIAPYELDIYIPSKKIAIEFNGNKWHSELNGKNKNYHLNKTKLCNEKGIRLIHIFEDEWFFKREIVKTRLKHILGYSKNKIYARKCEIKEINSKTKNEFLEKYHIQGKDVSSIRLGLFHNVNLVAVMTFGKTRFKRDKGYELIRYATISGHNIIGGPGKLLKYFERKYKSPRITTYADLRWSEGNLYKKLGFKHTHNSLPNYFYFNKNYLVRLNRMKFQKYKLKYNISKFDKNLTEWENMKNNGYDRIWDCGNMVFEK